MDNATFDNLIIRRDTAGAVADLLTLDSIDGRDGNGAALSFTNNSAAAELYMTLGRISARRVNAATVRLDLGVARDPTASSGDDLPPLFSLVSIDNDLSVLTAAGSTLAVGGALKVAGAASFSGTASFKSLTVTGRATLGTLRVGGSAILSTTLAVAGATSLGSLSVGGSASLTSVQVVGATVLGDSLSVGGATVLGDSLSVGGTASLTSVRVAGATVLDDNLSVGGAASLNSLRVSDATVLDGSLSVGGNASLSTTLAVAGAASLGSLSVGGAASLNSLRVAGATMLGDSLSVGGTTTLGGALTIAGVAMFNGGIGTADPRSMLRIAGRLSINPPIDGYSQHAIIFASRFGDMESYLARYDKGYVYQDLAVGHDLFPRVVLGAINEHLFIGTRSKHELVLSTNDRPRIVVGAAGKIVILKSQDDAELEIQGTLRAATFEGNGIIPRGVVVLWSGQLNALPSGWALCDGSNGTPDLRDRFIVGAGRGYGVGSTGGEALHQLTADEMPSHNHDNGIWRLLVSNAGDGTTQRTDYTPGEVNLLDARPIQPSGGNRPHENRPPYYALAFIMKL